MKTTKVKGFTLIELIVVMAIFGVILAGAMSLMQPVSKVMVQSETYEGGNAAVQSITNYLEKSMASAEFLDSYNYIPDVNAAVQDYATFYYEGVLKDNTTGDLHTINYADGRIHVITIDNSQVDTETGEISSQIVENIYHADFTNGAVTVTLEDTITDAINKAYYDDYDFQIKVGEHDELDWANPVAPTYDDFANNVSAGRTLFTIKATTKKRANGQVYSFFTNSSMTLSNISNRTLDSLCYYVIEDDKGADESDESDNLRGIVQIASPSVHARADGAPLAREYGSLLKNNRIFYNLSSDAFNNYCFIYSYGAEINTRG